MSFLLTVLLFTTILYSFAIIVISFGLFKIPNAKFDNKDKVSVIVAARNEEQNLPGLLSALNAQSIPCDSYEVILVNDDSTDGTKNIVQNFAGSNPEFNLKLVNAKNRDHVFSPKKNALSEGIKQSSGTVFMFTDADCAPPPVWISETLKLFSPQTGMVIGFSPYVYGQRESCFAKLVKLDSLALAALAAATSGWGRPATCNGRNLAYRKSVYEEVGGFDDISQFVSGDDDLLLKLVLNKTNWQVRYAYNARLVVPTKGLSGFRQFYNQRIRHASKGFYYGRKKVALLSLIYLYYLLLFMLLPVSLFTSLWLTGVCIFLLKAAGEFSLLFQFARKMGQTKTLKIFPIAEIFYTPYVVIFGLLGQFARFEWKGKTSGAKENIPTNGEGTR